MINRLETKMTVKYLDTIGLNAEFGGRGFHLPVDVSSNSESRIYVVSRSSPNPKGRVIDICDLNHEWYGEFCGDGIENGYMKGPTAITHHTDGRVFLADEELNRITIFSPDGEYENSWGEKGANPGEINGPSGLKFISSDELLVVDHLNNRIQRMTPEGEYMSSWGHGGSGEGEFNLPWGIDTDISGNIYVADWRNNRIQRFDSNEKFIDMFGSSGKRPGEFNRPSDVAVDKNGFIFVSDWGNQRVQVFDDDWNFQILLKGQATVSPWAQEYLEANADELDARTRFDPFVEVDTEDLHEMSSRKEGYFWDPISVEIDQEGRLIVVDSLRHRLQVYTVSA